MILPDSDGVRSYSYTDGAPRHTYAYLRPVLSELIAKERPARVFEIGCGSGAMAQSLLDDGIEVTGIDYSESAIEQARRHHPGARFEVGSAYDDLVAKFGRFPFVLSFEVVEHLFQPRAFAKSCFDLLEPGGVAVISTPYHGYLKNLALALTGRMDAHFTALWDGGHIKFWSMATLGELLREAGFEDIEFKRVGRVPPLARSMIAIARKPSR